MIYAGAVLAVIDNSGARYAQCIKILGKSTTRGRLGDKIVIVVKIATPKKKVAKHQIHKAIIVRDSKPLYRKDGSYITFDKPACVILKKDGQPLAKRISGPVCKELRNLGHVKLISIASLAL